MSSSIWRKVKIKTEVLDEIENFSANDELDVQVPREIESSERVKKSRDLRYLCEKDREERRRNLLSVKKEITPDEYVDFEEYVEALTTGRKYICSVCRIEFPNEAQFNTHMISHSHGKLFQCGLCAKQFSW